MKSKSSDSTTFPLGCLVKGNICSKRGGKVYSRFGVVIRHVRMLEYADEFETGCCVLWLWSDGTVKRYWYDEMASMFTVEIK